MVVLPQRCRLLLQNGGGSFFLFFFPPFFVFYFISTERPSISCRKRVKRAREFICSKKNESFWWRISMDRPSDWWVGKKKKSGSQSGAPVGGSNTVVQWNFKKYLKKNKRNTQRFASPLEINWKFWWRQVSNKSSRKKERKKERKEKR